MVWHQPLVFDEPCSSWMWMALLYWKREVKQIEPGLPHAAHKVHAVRRHRARLLITYCCGQRVCAHVSWLWQCPIVDDSHLYFSQTSHSEMVIICLKCFLPLSFSLSHPVCSALCLVQEKKNPFWAMCVLTRTVVVYADMLFSLWYLLRSHGFIIKMQL